MSKLFILRDDEIKNNCVEYILNLTTDKLMSVRVEEFKSKRSLQQNKLMWLWYSVIAKFWHDSTGDWYNPDIWHEELKEKFLGFESIATPNGIKRRLRSTTKLNTAQFTEYLENIDHYMGSKFGYQLPHPEDIYFEAMGKNNQNN